MAVNNSGFLTMLIHKMARWTMVIHNEQWKTMVPLQWCLAMVQN